MSDGTRFLYREGSDEPYAWTQPVGIDGETVHVMLDLEQRAAWQRRDEASSQSKFAFGPWFTVTDVETDETFEVRRAPCGLGCRCATEGRRAR